MSVLNKLLIGLFLMSIFECSTNSQDISFIYPENLQIKQYTDNSFYLVIHNTSNDTLIIEAINTSCNCILADKNLPSVIHPKKNDSIKFTLKSNKIGERTENVVIVHNFKNRFKSLKINYEVH